MRAEHFHCVCVCVCMDRETLLFCPFYATGSLCDEPAAAAASSEMKGYLV